VKKLAVLILIFLVLGLLAALLVYRSWTSPISKDGDVKELIISEDMSYDSLDSLLRQDYVSSQWPYTSAAKAMRFEQSSVKPGRYLIDPSLSPMELIRKLRSGRQDPVILTINSVRTIADLSAQVSEQVQMDSAEWHDYVLTAAPTLDPAMTAETVMSVFLPNSYEVYWTITPEALMTKLSAAHKRYWSDATRVQRLEDLNLSATEVYTLASIVQKETAMVDEQPRVAGVYLNRLERGMALQADPTVIFGVGDFTIRRVLNKHLAFDSPYNTYIYPGLPPGPICMPDMSCIEAVLHAEDHKYIYFCARPDWSGYHNFAITLRQHNVNAAAYRNSL